MNTRAWAAYIALFVSTSASAAFDLQITEIWPGNEPGSNLSEDWFEIVNDGDTAWIAGVDEPLYYDDDSQDPAAADLISGITDIQPGEAVIVVIEAPTAVQAFIDLWSPVYELDGVEVGSADGSGLGQGGDGVTLFVGGPTADTVVDFEAFPDANQNGGQSFDVLKGGFSEAGEMPFLPVVTQQVNDEGQPAIGSPGNLGPTEIIGEIPVITLLGDNPFHLVLNDDFVDPGAAAFDEEDGDLTDAIVVGGDTVDSSTLGTYVVTYSVVDADGNEAVPAARDVIVSFPETIPPAPVARRPDFFSHVATLGELPGAEIPAYDARSRQVYLTSGGGLQIVDLADPANPLPAMLIDPAAAPFNLNSSAVTSVDACGGTIAFAVPSDPQTDNGTVVFTDAQGELIRTVTVGALPDMLTFTDDCSSVLTANEGEPDDGIDPEGSISIVEVATGTVRTADFLRFNGQEDALRANGVRIFPGVSAANDFEPEYIAIAPDGERAYVTLQEANALAVVNIRRARVTDILPLGLKDHSQPGNELDASDRDGVINIQNWPLFGMYMPDAIAAFGFGPFSFYVTANEGDARDADERAEDLDLDPAVFPDADALQNAFAIGRIEVSSIDGDIDGDGDYDALQSYGARSFSIWNGRGRQIYDSGSDIEAIVATYAPDSYDDGRSDNKGPEPEGVEVGTIFGRNYAFIGLERTGQVLVYDLTLPWAPAFVQLLERADDEAPEGLQFISGLESPNRCPTLLVANEGSSTLSVYQLTRCRAGL